MEQYPAGAGTPFHPDHHQRTAELALFRKLRNADPIGVSIPFQVGNNQDYVAHHAKGELRATGEGALYSQQSKRRTDRQRKTALQGFRPREGTAERGKLLRVQSSFTRSVLSISQDRTP